MNPFTDALFPIVMTIGAILLGLVLVGVVAQLVGYRYTKGVLAAQADERRRYNQHRVPSTSVVVPRQTERTEANRW